jgi:cysteine-rich repeat protein
VEDCDDANDDDTDACVACQQARCGDGAVYGGVEGCDDGNQEGGDGCAADCSKVELCGDGVVDVGEACDDANDNPADGCDNACAEVVWAPTVVAGLGRGGGEPDLTPIAQPSSLTATTDGTVYIADAGQGVVFRVTPDDNVVVEVSLGARVDDIVATETGQLFIAIPGQVLRYELGTASLVPVIGTAVPWPSNSIDPTLCLSAGPSLTERQMGSFLQIDVDGQGNLYVLDRDTECVLLIDVDGQLGVLLNETDYDLERPSGLAHHRFPPSADEQLVIADTGHHEVVTLSLPGLQVSSIAGDGTRGTPAGAAGTSVFADEPLDLPTTVSALGPTILFADGLDRLWFVSTDFPEERFRLSGSPAAGSGAPRPVAIDGFRFLYTLPRYPALVFEDDGTGMNTSIVFNGSRVGGLAAAGYRLSRAPLVDIRGVARDGDDLYIAVPDGVLRASLPDGVLEPIVGNGTRGSFRPGVPAIESPVADLQGIAVSQGRLFLVDDSTSQLLEVQPDGTLAVVTVFPGAVELDPLVTGRNLVCATDRHVVAVRPSFNNAGIVAYAHDLETAITTVVEPFPLVSSVACSASRIVVHRPGFSVNDAVLEYGSDLELIGSFGLPLSGWDGVGVRPSGAVIAYNASPNENTADDPLIERALDGSITYPGQTGSPLSGDAIVDGMDLTQLPAEDIDGWWSGGGEDIFLQAGKLRRVTAAGTIETLAGNPLEPHGTDGLRHAQLPAAAGISLIDDDTLLAFIDDRVATIDLGGESVSTVIGNPEGRLADPAPDAIRLSQRGAVAWDATAEVLYIAEPEADRILRLTPGAEGLADGTVEVWAGESAEDPNNQVVMSSPTAVAVDPTDGHLWVANAGSHVVYKLDQSGGGSGTFVLTSYGRFDERGYFGDDGEAIVALFNEPSGLAVADGGALYIADTGNHRVRRIDPDTNIISTVLGDGQPATVATGGAAGVTPVLAPRELALDAFGNLYATGSTGILQVQAGLDGVAAADDRAALIFGGTSASAFPASQTRCLHGLAVTSAGSVLSTDRCLGMLIEVRRGCGNGVVEAGEACDDGNRDDGDGCTHRCTLPVCGDGIRSADEACDDNNTTAFDGCDACAVEDPRDLVEGRLIINEIVDHPTVAGARFVEVANIGLLELDATGWELRRYANGQTEAEVIDLGILTSWGAGVTIAFVSNFDDFQAVYADPGSIIPLDFPAISGDGNDVYALFNGDELVDVYGEIGVDGAGEAWEYTDQRVTRGPLVTFGSPVWSASEWTISATTNDATPGRP